MKEAEAFLAVHPLILIVNSLSAVIGGWVGFHTIIGDAIGNRFGASLASVVVVNPNTSAPPAAPDYSPTLAHLRKPKEK